MSSMTDWIVKLVIAIKAQASAGLLPAVFLGLLLPINVQAHHSFGAFYDMDSLVELEGEILSIFWRNPHIRFNLEVRNDDGSTAVWDLEAGSVNTLQRFGIDRDVIRVGGSIKVAGPASLHGLNAMFVASITLPAGDQVILNPNLARNLPDIYQEIPEKLSIDENLISAGRAEANGIFRVWIPVSRPNTGSGLLVWPLTNEGQIARDNWDPLIDDPALRCIPPGVPVAMDSPYPFEFTDMGETIVIRLEEWDGVRTIYMHPDAIKPELSYPRMGYSVGHWRGNTLIVTTTDVEYPFFDDVGSPQSPQAVIVEEFSLSQENSRLDWTAQVTDSQYYSEPVTLSGHWQWAPGEQIKTYQCTQE
tara:strand:- start:37660 stop:38742 length:1083 start_codon:yes stop_codon:yes gene_type:complete